MCDQPFWSDGAEKTRYLSLPDNTSFSINADGDWELPAGGVLIKHFQWEGVNFETRFFVRYNNGSYGAYTYEWTSAKDATLVNAAGKDTLLAGGQAWRYPSRNECFQCHTVRAGYILGPESRQLNIEKYYSEKDLTANQFHTLLSVGMLSGNTIAPVPFPAIDDTDASLEERAQAYLHVNCSSCHRGTGGAQSIWDARFTTPFEDKGICKVTPIAPVTGLEPEFYLNPGKHLSSSLWWRAQHRGQSQMPPLGTTVVDRAGAGLLLEWIDSLDANACGL